MTASVSPDSLPPRTSEAQSSTVRDRRLWRAGIGVVAAGLLLTGLIGVLHLPFAAPLLRRISPGSLCPVTHGTPAQIDRAHALGAASIRASSSVAAPSRPALGFALDHATRADLDAWAARYGVSCSNLNGNENLRRCADVPARAVGQAEGLGPLEEITFELRASGELVTVQTLRRGLPAARAAEIAAALEQQVASEVGPPSTTGGEATAAHLARGFLSSYVAEHTFHDYRASVTATNLDRTGVMVRESYLSARPWM